MHDKHLYEYAIIRVVPAVEREEFINAGIILFCKKAGYIKVLQRLNTEKLALFPSETDPETITQNLNALQKIANGDSAGGPIACMDVPSRFRWLTAVRSSLIQTSRPHPGLCENLDETADRLFRELVL